MTLSTSELKQPLGFVGIMAALVCCVLSIQTSALSRLRAQEQSIAKPQIERDVAERANRIAVLSKMPSFGFNNLIANTMLIDYMQYFGEEKARNINGYSLGLDYFDLILAKDPRFYISYFYMSVTGNIYSAQPERSVAIMEKGFKSIDPRTPENSYYLWRLKGTDELLFLGNGKAAQKSMQTAADWANKVNDEESRRVSAMSQTTANFLAKNPNSKQAQFAAWMMVIENAVDIKAQKIALRKILELGGKVELDSKGQIKITPPPKD
jgi:hypothetical protein